MQFVHGLEGSPQGAKARLLADHFEALTPAMDTADFEASVSAQQRALEAFRPDVLVGSSFGGAVAVALLEREIWRGPTLLLAQAASRRRPDACLPEGVAVFPDHSTAHLAHAQFGLAVQREDGLLNDRRHAALGARRRDGRCDALKGAESLAQHELARISPYNRSLISNKGGEG